MQNSDIPALVILTKLHRLEGLLHKSLPNNVPSEIEQCYTDNKLKQLKFTGELVRLDGLFKSDNLEFLSFKGPALSQQLYGDPTERSGRDIDLLIRLKDVKSALELMKIEGYKLTIKFATPKQFSTILEYYHHFEFYHPEKDLTVEIHWRISSHNNFLPSDIIWSNHNVISIAGKEINVLSPLHEALFLCVHGAKHCYFRLHWVADIYHHLITKDHAFINELVALSKKENLLTPVMATFQLLVQLYPELEEELGFPNEISKRSSKLAEICIEQIVLNTSLTKFEDRKSRITRMRLHHKVNYLFGGVSGWFKGVIQRNVRPKNWETFAFPDSVFFLNHFFSRIIWLFTPRTK